MKNSRLIGSLAASAMMMASSLGAAQEIRAVEQKAPVQRRRTARAMRSGVLFNYGQIASSPNGGHAGKHRTNRQYQRAAAKKRNKA